MLKHSCRCQQENVINFIIFFIEVAQKNENLCESKVKVVQPVEQ